MANRKIKNDMRLFVPLALLAISLIVIAFGLRIHRQFRAQSIKNFQENQLTMARGAVQGVESQIESLRSQVDMLSLDTRVRDVTDPDCLEALKDIYYGNSGFIYAGYRIDAQGRIAQMYPPNPRAVGADISTQEHVREIFEKKRFIISGRFRAVEGFDAVTMHAPVFREAGFDGSVAALVRVSVMAETFIKPLKNSQGGEGWLIDDAERIVYHPDPAMYNKSINDLKDLGGKDPAAEVARLARDIATGQSGSGTYGDMLVAFSPMHMGTRNWSVVMVTPKAAISGPIQRNFSNTLLFMGVVLVLMYGAAYWLFRSNMKTSHLEMEKLMLEEKVALQDELRRGRDQLATIISTMPSGLFTVDREKTILSWNETAEKITGFTAEEVVGKECSVIGMNTCRFACGLMNDALPKPIIGAECIIRTKSGEERIISKNIENMTNAAGEITGGIEIFIDITDAKRAEEARIASIALEKEVQQLRHMDEIKTNFLSMVSHELRTPLSVILGNVALALRGRFGKLEPGLEQRLETVQKRATQLNILIENLLNLSRLETGRMDIKREPMEVRPCVEEALAALSDDIRRHMHTVSLSLSEDAPLVFADRNTLLQVFANLLSNAIKFTPDNGHIEISSAPAGEFVEFRIKDCGVGIPAEALERVFDRFYQVDNSPTRAYGGSGLGLSIVKEIIDLHKGEIYIKSAEEQGTEVVFRLHRPDAHQGLTRDGSLLEQPKPDTGGDDAPARSILVIEDDVDFLNMACDIFSDAPGLKVMSAGNAARGLEIMRSDPPDIVLLDLLFSSGMDGFELLSAAGKDTLLRGIPIVIVTASADEKNRERAISLGARDYIIKPVNAEDLIRRAAALMRDRHET